MFRKRLILCKKKTKMKIRIGNCMMNLLRLLCVQLSPVEGNNHSSSTILRTQPRCVGNYIKSLNMFKSTDFTSHLMN
jgi:hypothetical protein